MKHTVVSATLAIALVSPCISPSASASAAHGTLPLAQLGALLDDASAATAAPAVDSPPLLWFTDEALADPAQRASARSAYLQGVAVAVLRGPVTREADLRIQGIFDVSSTAQLAIYLRGRDGTPQLHTVAELPSESHGRRRLIAQLIEGVATDLRMGKAATRAKRQAQGEDSSAQAALPMIASTQTEYASSGNGAAVTLRAEVVRDSSRSHDALVVSARSEHTLKPHHNGLDGGNLRIPGRYRYYMRLDTLDNRGTTPTLKEFRPQSSPSTQLQINESQTTETSYGFGFSQQVSAGLEGKVPSIGAKSAFSFDYSRTYSRTNALSFAVNDYSIATGATRPAAQASTAFWDLQLAAQVASNADYFGKSPTMSRMTPSMNQVSAQGSAVWSVPGTYSGIISVLAGGEIANLQYTGDRIESVPDPLPQPTAAINIDATSPYLTRETTVFIQSKAGNGGCLRDDNGVVRIAPCPDTADPNWMEDLHAQWQLDSNGRYYNRGSQQCMQVLTTGMAPNGSGEIITRPCTINRDQQWEWQADRIHSRYGDGYPEWRMHIADGGIIGVRTTGLSAFQRPVVNPFHPLLNPWSAYPNAPSSNDFVPRLENLGPSQPLAEELKSLGPVPARERWELVVLRQSMHR